MKKRWESGDFFIKLDWFFSFFRKFAADINFLTMMKRLIFICFALVLGSAAAMAVPAKPGVKKTVTLSDGTKVELTLRGDEHYRFYTGNDGFAYLKRGEQFERLSVEDAHAQWTKGVAKANKLRKPRTRGAGDSKAPLTGKRKGLVILMEFADVKFTTTDVLAVYQDFFNKENLTDYGMSGSVSDYFKAQSYGNFELEFDVVGPFTSKYDMEYYGGNILDEEGYETDAHPFELVHEGCLKADSLVNFADYDWDGDGEVDQVFVIYAGYAEAQGGAPETIWPHEYGLEEEKIYLDLDDVHINTYACSSELMLDSGNTLDGIGTACHEFSHCLGFPDFYDTAGDNFGMCYWDIMASGSYNGNSYIPAGYTSYERWVAGWLTPTELKGDETQISNMKALVDSPEAYILYNEANKDEYYLLENRQLRGFDAGLYGHGLLVVHVDYDANAWSKSENNVNTDPLRQRMTIIPADGELGIGTGQLAGDPYPGTMNNTSLKNSSEPAALLNTPNVDGTYYMSKPIDDITESDDGLISFVAMHKELQVPAPDDGEAVGDENSFTITWPAVDGAIGYQVEVTELGIVPSNVADALEHSADFAQFVTDTVGTTDLGKNLADFGLEGWYGRNIFTSPNKLLLVKKEKAAYIDTDWWNMPKSTEITMVIGVDKPIEEIEARCVVFFIYKDKTDEDYENVYEGFDFTKKCVKVLHFNTRKDLYRIQIQGRPQMYLDYLAVYNGTWSEEDLGLSAAGSRGTTRSIEPVVYNTDTNSYTFTDLSKDCKYCYRVRAVDERSYYSGWSSQKVFMFNTTGITNIMLNSSDNSQRIFNLQGRSMGTDFNALPRGIYIIGGKKVVK